MLSTVVYLGNQFLVGKMLIQSTVYTGKIKEVCDTQVFCQQEERCIY